jgi:hypothetical protein
MLAPSRRFVAQLRRKVDVGKKVVTSRDSGKLIVAAKP